MTGLLEKFYGEVGLHFCSLLLVPPFHLHHGYIATSMDMMRILQWDSILFPSVLGHLIFLMVSATLSNTKSVKAKEMPYLHIIYVMILVCFILELVD